MNLDSTDAARSGHSRRTFLQSIGVGAAALALTQKASAAAGENVAIQGFEQMTDKNAYDGWKPFSDRKIRVGLVGYGVSRFSAAFGFQDHPNVEVYAVSDLIPERCAELAKRVNCSRTYPSLEEMVKDDKIEAIYVATDAPNHFKHALEVLKHGKHVAVAVPAVFGRIDQAEELVQAVKRSGLNYMMFETSYYRQDLTAMREIYKAGGFGKIAYTEGEYLHYQAKPIDSYLGWRVGSIPMWYPTHATAYLTGVSGETFTEVSCLGMKSLDPYLQPEANKYKNPFGTEVGLFRTSGGAMARMTVSKDTPGFGAETGRLRGTKGSFLGEYQSAGKYQGELKQLPSTRRPPLPTGMPLGGHGGSHAYLTNEFVHSILQKRKPAVDVAMALNITVPGIVAHQSALKNGELMKIPQYHF